ncbi:ABC transporter, permease protein [[Eubacterium] yurii subsp. margaretiae ATCC 43715]|nr:ABC transporter, permease protein [[Eubacterium] yurii subsp. margaretiae ATCC 43715]
MYTIGLSLVSVLMGILIGLVLAFFRLSKAKILNLISTTYIELIRGTPLLAQIMLVKFGLYDLITAKTKISIPDIAIGIIAVSLNSGAYVCEIIRSGISSVDKGQMEAGRSLGMSKSMTMRLIVLPLAVKNILPALCNEFVTVIKETSIISYIGVTDLFYIANAVSSMTYKSFESMLAVALIYFIITFTLSKLVRLLERRLSQSD